MMIMKVGLLVLVLMITQIHAELSVDPVTNVLRDEHNRYRVMHGVNVVYKEFPFYPIRT